MASCESGLNTCIFSGGAPARGSPLALIGSQGNSIRLDQARFDPEISRRLAEGVCRTLLPTAPSPLYKRLKMVDKVTWSAYYTVDNINGWWDHGHERYREGSPGAGVEGRTNQFWAPEVPASGPQTGYGDRLGHTGRLEVRQEPVGPTEATRLHLALVATKGRIEMTEWSVRIELAGEFTEEDADRVVTSLAKSSPATGFGPGELDAQFCVEAGNAQDAIKKGVNLLMAALKKPARVTGVEALSMEDLDRSIAESNAPDLVGVSELAGLLKVSKQRISRLSSAPEFPKPIATLAAGPIWRKIAIARFAEAWERRPGRPRKAAHGPHGRPPRRRAPPSLGSQGHQFRSQRNPQ
jgi:hypothetical protein